MAIADQSNREKEIFEQALDITSPEERLRFLTSACGKDPALLARVQALLRADESGESFLPGQPKAGVVPITEKPGDHIGRYKLLQQIGEGGCGAVYMAEQEEPVRRRVALKVIKLGMDTKQVIARFEAERQALALMDHPNIAKVLDAGATETGRPYFVMELVRGIKITEFCDEKSVSMADRLKLFTQVCQAIQHAHQKGVIHRDIKPSNILVTVNDGVPVPKVIDFGIAKATAGPLTDKTFFTAFEQFIGTPAYMSPEQAEMSSLDIDTRTDIYSLGVLLYELLTGRPPLDPSELLQSGLDEMRRAIREKEPDRPSTRLGTMAEDELTTVATQRHTEAPRLIHLVRGDLDWIVMKCLEKDRARRYETANGLAADIRRHLHNETVVARPPSALYRIEKLVRRNRLAFTAAALVALALVFGIVASTWQAIRATHFRQEAQGEARRASAEALANRQNLYAADMILANHALENYNLPRARELLEKYRPPEGRPSNSPLHSDLRGWEWRYLMGRCRSDEVATLGRFGSRVFTVSISGDGRWLAAACGDGTVRLWDMRTRKQVPFFETYRLPASSFEGEDRRHAVAFSPDCRTLAAGGINKDIFLWDVVEHRRVAILTGHQGTVDHLAFSPDGRFLASASLDETARLWNMRSNPPRELAKLEPHNGGVLCAAFSSDSKALVTGGQLAPVKLWDVSNPQAPRQIGSLNSGWVMHAVFSPDGTRLATCDGNQSAVRLFEFPSLRELKPLRGQPGVHGWLAFSPDGRRLASAGGNLCICLWDLEQPENLQMLKGHDQDPQCLAFTPDGTTLVSGGTDGTVRLWDMATNSAAGPEFRCESWIHRVAFSRDSRYAAVLAAPAHFILWDVVARRQVATQDFATTFEAQIEFSPDGKTVCVTSAGRARWFEIPSLRLLKEEPADRLVFAQDGGFAMLVRQGQIIRRDYPSGAEVSLGSNAIASISAALSPDGETFVIGGEEGKLALWGTHRPGSQTMLEGHKTHVWGLAFSLDGKWFASASWDGTIGLWRPNGRLVRFLRGHNGAVDDVDFSRDSRTLASSADDGTIKLWSLASMQEATTLHGHEGPVSSLAFSPNGNYLLSGGGGAVRLWKAPTFEEISAAERMVEPKK